MNKLMTIAELQSRIETELRALFHQATLAVTRTATGTVERRTGLATMENISRALTTQMGARGF
jgi:hypothetical protein